MKKLAILMAFSLTLSIAWAQEIFSLSQSGLTYSGNEYDRERYKRLQEITAEMIASQSRVSKETVLDSFSMQAGYITPKVDVRGAVVHEGKILLIQERADGNWAMPGGWPNPAACPPAPGRACRTTDVRPWWSSTLRRSRPPPPTGSSWPAPVLRRSAS